MSQQPNPLLDAISVGKKARHARAVPDAATGRPFAYVAESSPTDLDIAVERAKVAQKDWAALSHAQRSAILRRAAEEVEENLEDLARIIAQEQGKPISGMGARFEAGGCAVWIRTAAEAVIEPEVVFEAGDSRSELHYVPLGVVGAISPWNWPALIAIWQIAPALRMGNTVVAKPSEYTPLSVLAVIELMNRHLPEGVLIGIAGGREIGAGLAAHPDVAKVMFTGSTRTGREIVKASANNLARLTLELGGNDPGIVLPGANVKELAPAIFGGAFINTGQTCAALKRLYVHVSVHDELVAELKQLAESAVVGPGLDEDSQFGPLTTKQQFDIVRTLVKDAKKNGAKIVAGGKPLPDLGPQFFAPTIVTEVTDGVAIVDEEQFGPVLPIIRYRDVDEVIDQANASDQALGASVWGDRERALQVAERIESGTVWINQHGTLNPVVPFGGVKASGYGLEFGTHGLKAVAAPKVITV